MQNPPPHIGSMLQRYFDKILVLTVRRFVDRQKTIKTSMEGIEFDFFYGVDKATLTEQFIEANYFPENEKQLAFSMRATPMTVGELACALSHRMIYQAILKHEWKSVLILEDDAILLSDQLNELVASLDELPEDWELCYLGYSKNERATAGKKIKQQFYLFMCQLGWGNLPKAWIKRTLPKSFGQHLNVAGFHDCTHAYAIRAGAAQKLLEAQTPVNTRADNLLSLLVLNGQLNSYALKQGLFVQDPLQTSNIR